MLCWKKKIGLRSSWNWFDHKWCCISSWFLDLIRKGFSVRVYYRLKMGTDVYPSSQIAHQPRARKMVPIWLYTKFSKIIRNIVLFTCPNAKILWLAISYPHLHRAQNHQNELDSSFRLEISFSKLSSRVRNEVWDSPKQFRVHSRWVSFRESFSVVRNSLSFENQLVTLLPPNRALLQKRFKSGYRTYL